MKSASEFWAKVDVSGDCWLWQASADTRGYGNLSWHGKTTRAHRLAYVLAYGSIPIGNGHHGNVVMHTCDNRLCCNPDHLRVGTHADNMSDMANKGRRKKICDGEANGRAVLSAADVEKIRSDVRGTRTIAKDYPVSRSAIQRIKSGKAWE